MNVTRQELSYENPQLIGPNPMMWAGSNSGTSATTCLGSVLTIIITRGVMMTSKNKFFKDLIRCCGTPYLGDTLWPCCVSRGAPNFS